MGIRARPGVGRTLPSPDHRSDPRVTPAVGLRRGRRLDTTGVPPASGPGHGRDPAGRELQLDATDLRSTATNHEPTRALANRPEILLLDEPTSALDDDTEGEVERLICRLAREYSLTCLMVTHDDAQAARLATMILLLEHGRLARYGPLGEVSNVR